MNRRTLIVTGAAIAMFGAMNAASSAGATLPRRNRVRVAFMLGDNANVIDTAGPWEVFQDTAVPAGSGAHLFQLYTVGRDRSIVRMSGGLRVRPDFTPDNAPQPNVIVVPAQRTDARLLAWLRSAGEEADVVASICTGAFQLARAGMLAGVPATTHHEFWDRFAEEFPDIELRRGVRFVDSGRIATAGGLTSGIDMALHIVARYYGREVAAATARYMEHDSTAWDVGVAGLAHGNP